MYHSVASLSEETKTEEPSASQSKEQARQKSTQTKKIDSYKSDTASIGQVQASATDEDGKSKGDSYKSDTESIGKIQETTEKKSEKKNEQRAREEG